jgi:hypothetical protein
MIIRLILSILGFCFIQSIYLIVIKKTSIIIYLLVYMDDIIVANSSHGAVDALLADLKSEFALKDLCDLHYFLGIEVKKTIDALLLTHEKVASNLLSRVGMTMCNEVSNPCSTGEKLSVHLGGGGVPLYVDDSTKYQSIVDALQYLALT